MHGEAFFSKDIDPGTPAWLPRVQVQHRSGTKFHPVFDSAVALAWLGQVSALELHVPQWRIAQPAGPTGTPAGGWAWTPPWRSSSARPNPPFAADRNRVSR